LRPYFIAHMDHSHWNPGDTVVLRGVAFGKLAWAMPCVVVQDTDERIALYWRTGTHWKNVEKHGTPQDILSSEIPKLFDFIWDKTDVLMLSSPGESHAVWIMWEQGHTKLNCWYINLETPLCRTSIGFDTLDQELDIIISPDRSEWRWKDEKAFEALVDAGVFSIDEARAIRAEGERVIQRALANESPFCDGWEKWLPPIEWAIPELPRGWDKL
jgi:hypothetical protein